MFIRTINRHVWQRAVSLVAVLCAGAVLLAYPEAVATGVNRGLALCGSVILPSLLPFLVLSGFVIRSGLGAAIGRRLSGVMGVLFGLPGCCATALVISMVGGYPAGGMAVRELLDQGEITKEEAARLLRCSVNGGPAFIISGVGAAMMGSVRYGVLLYVAHVVTSLLVGIVGGCGHRKTRRVVTKSAPTCTTAGALVEAVNSACRALLYMGGFVIVCSALLSLLDTIGIDALLEDILLLPLRLAGENGSVGIVSCLLEVSCGCAAVVGNGGAAPFLLGFALGWGGLSVHGQIAAVLSGRHCMGRRFFFARAVHGVVGGLLSLLLCQVVPLPEPVFQNATVALSASGSVVAASALLMLCGLWLAVISRKTP